MAAKVFLSLSYVDRLFVKDVRSRLPSGLSYFYEESFENGEQLLKAMERAVSDSTIFVLFASKQAIASPWVNFEIDLARLEHIQTKNHRILIFPTSPDVSSSELPKWLRNYWVPKAGLLTSDIARYITKTILEPDTGISDGAIRVVGRGKTLDRLEQLSADHLLRKNRSPSVVILAGFTGVGRRTFGNYYIRRALAADSNLAFGPTLGLSPQADLIDLYKALRSEISVDLPPSRLAEDLQAFQNAATETQLTETNRLVGHFTSLGQALTIVSAGGFFEDRGEPKDWVKSFFSAVDPKALIFIVANRQFPDDWLSDLDNSVQMRVEELSDKDIRALMIFTAQRLRVDNFSISDDLVRAIGGHADVANAAVRLAALKGMHILERDPRQIFNVQLTILGDNIAEDSLNATEKLILHVLGWVPSLGGNLLEQIVRADGKVTEEMFVEAIENLILGCLVIATGYNYSISPAIRQLFRRWHITPKDLLDAFAKTLSEEWKRAESLGRFRTDLFDAFVFMHALEGKSLPPELQSLLSPGTLYDVVREAYARGKDAEDRTELERVAEWGAIAESMKMSEATREEILSTVVRARIRLGEYDKADKTIEKMSGRGNRSVLFLRGHSLRRQEKYEPAIKLLEDAIRERKYRRSALHELALAYKKSGKTDKLRILLDEHQELVRDSAMFSDFQIGVDLARGNLPAAEARIESLARMPDDDGKSDIRRAQLLLRRSQYKPAKDLLSNLLRGQNRDRFRIRSLRAIAAAKDKDFVLAKQDLDFIKGMPSRQEVAQRLAAKILVEQGELEDAENLISEVRHIGAEDQLLYARIYELKAELPETGLADREKLKARAAEIRVQYRFVLEYEDYED